MIRIRVSKKSLSDLDKKLKKLIERIDNPRPILNDIANYMVRVTQNRITTSKRGPDGTRWADNSELTQYLKGKNSPNYASGELASSISVIRRDRYGFSVGTKLAYGAYVQEGQRVMKGKYKSKTKPAPQIPARPFMGFSDQNKVKIAKMMREYIRTGADIIPEDAE
jgi:phage virion morphogenesis protein